MGAVPHPAWHHADRQKRCISCEAVKPTADFYAYGYTNSSGNRTTRYESRCKPCSRARRLAQYAANKPAEKARIAKWRSENQEHRRVYGRAYYARSERHRSNIKLHSRTRKARLRAGLEPRPETRPAVRAIYAKAIEISRVTGVQHHVDHIHPLSRGGEHVIENLQILTAAENLRKGATCRP
jgi:5-methylcytosine-specific restriction endonuclease McrA